MQENYETDLDGIESRVRMDPATSDLDLETALLRLEEEQQRLLHAINLRYGMKYCRPT